MRELQKVRIELESDTRQGEGNVGKQREMQFHNKMYLMRDDRKEEDISRRFDLDNSLDKQLIQKKTNEVAQVQAELESLHQEYLNMHELQTSIEQEALLSAQIEQGKVKEAQLQIKIVML